MEQSILKSTKKILGIGPDDDSFDLDVLTHVNSVFSTLQQLGIGPETGFTIEDDTVNWGDYLIDDPLKLNQVRTYVYLRVRLLFDPPTTSYLLTAVQKQLEECEWRLNVHREETDWVDPAPGFLVVDGGDPSGEI
jgi:hypothetical protein